MRTKVRLAVIGASVVMLAGGTLSAFADTVTVSFNGGTGTRTLELRDLQGNNLTNLDMSGGTNSFVAKVVDSSFTNTGYTVQAEMSNLYGYDAASNTWNCSQEIPSSKLALSSPSGLLSVNGVIGYVTPVFNLSGDLSSVLGLAPGVGQITNQPVTGQALSLTQSELTALSSSNLIGSTLAQAMTRLPMSIASGAGGAFSTPAADPSGSNCGISTGSNATNVQVMSGAPDASGLLSDVEAIVQSATNTAAPTATDLVADGVDSTGVCTTATAGCTAFLTVNQVLAMVSTALGTNSSLLTSSQVTGILNTLTTTVGSGITLVSTATGQSGNYSSQPAMAINTSGIGAGSYSGQMTVTLISQ